MMRSRSEGVYVKLLDGDGCLPGVLNGEVHQGWGARRTRQKLTDWRMWREAGPAYTLPHEPNAPRRCSAAVTESHR